MAETVKITSYTVLRRPVKQWLAVVLAMCVFVVSSLFVLPGWIISPKLTEVLSQTPGYSEHRDVDSYDSEMVSRWHSGSACSGLRNQFVGDQPLFPPCHRHTPPGVATWGTYPYVGPFKFMNTSKNPCWIGRSEDWKRPQLQCLPYFYLIGVSKSGTTDLYARISLHPRVQHTVKEPHWFDRRRYYLSQDSKDFSDYVRFYRKVAQKVEYDISHTGSSSTICGDSTPSYFYDNYNWPMYSGNENCTEPRVISASHIYHLNPDVKIILIIRHPVARMVCQRIGNPFALHHINRALRRKVISQSMPQSPRTIPMRRLYSRYLFDYGRGSLSKDTPSPQKFHRYVVHGLRLYRDCFNRWSLRHCVYNRTLWESVHALRIQESMYPVFLEDWVRVIPRDQFLFLRFEDYGKNMTKELIKIYQFLGLEILNPKAMEYIVSSRIHNQGRLKKVTGPMLSHTEHILQEFYHPFIRRLAAMLDDDRFLWKDLDLFANRKERMRRRRGK